MAKRGSPALYELLGRARSGAKQEASAPIPVKIPPRESGRASIGGGIKLPSQRSGGRDPAGTPTTSASVGSTSPAGRRLIDRTVLRILGGSALGLAILIGVYKFGASRGTEDSGNTQVSDAGASIERVIGEDSASASASLSASESASGTPSTTVTASRPSPQPAPATNQAAIPNPTPAASSRAPAASADPELGPALGPTPAGLDPRQAGLNYWVLASVLEANAPPIVQYCRDRGLDAWVVPDQNGRLREITVLPGIPKSELNGPTANAIKSRVRKIGAQLKAAGRVNDGFEGAYFKLFKG